MNLLDRLRTHPEFPSRLSTYTRWYPKTLQAVPEDAWTSLNDPPHPAGIYIHVPFCDRLCRFCPFNKREMEADVLEVFVEAVKQELSLYSNSISLEPMDFVYFGGGTPSVMNERQIAGILGAIDDIAGLTKDTEITLESHPTHIDDKFTRSIRKVGINRISTGIQAFDDHLLQQLGAQHSTFDAERAIAAACSVFENVAIDLLFRCPEQTVDHWETQLRRAIGEQCINHISCYSLILKNSDHLPSLDLEAQMTVSMIQVLESCGFKHYASCASGGFDFAKDDATCDYEYDHWAAPQAQFLGLGPGAFGFVGGRTTVNRLAVDQYSSDILDHYKLPLVSAMLARTNELMRRYFVLGVKTLSVPFGPFEEQFSQDPRSVFSREFAWLARQELADIDDRALVLTELGRLFVDQISAIFFSETERDAPHPEEPQIRAVEVTIS